MAVNTEEREGCQFSLTETLEEATQQGEALELELKRNRDVLSDLQATLLKVAKSRDAARLQLSSTERAIENHSDEIVQLQLRATDLESDSQATYLENIKLQHEIEENKDSFQLTLAGYNTYRNKMDSHKVAIFKQESQTAVHRELTEKRRLINHLKAEREKLKVDLQNPEGNVVRQAQKEVDELRVQISAVKGLVFHKTQLLAKEHETHTHLRKDIEIQNRRCDAILRRLRCQLNKAQSNHRQLTGDICWLEKEVADLRRRLAIQEGTEADLFKAF
ncbi:coiled-coil domain-containing protein 122 [Conger conger]|uniref:coiled-coil domain-containing protein 122 n=1 Tax=Conger conger TaxID=82655 RepID=UPI002A5A1483|nr:coiled-coil domain-containing protein 122 [Conger conger]